MLGIIEQNLLYDVAEGKGLGLRLKPPTEDLIERAKYSLILIGVVGVIALAITGLMTWLFLPPIIGHSSQGDTKEKRMVNSCDYLNCDRIRISG